MTFDELIANPFVRVVNAIGWAYFAVIVVRWIRRRRSRSRNVVAFRRETTFGALPPIDGGKMRIAPATGVMMKTAPAETWGDVDFECPKCHAIVSTRDGNQTSRGYLFGFGIPAVVTMTGVLCRECRSSYTVEMTEDPVSIEGPTPSLEPTVMIRPSEGIPPTSAYRRWLEAPVKSPDLDPRAEGPGAEPG